VVAKNGTQRGKSRALQILKMKERRMNMTPTSGIDLIPIMETGLTNMQTQANSMIGAVVPVAFGIMVAVIVVKFGMRLFRNLVRG
jgi:hypothetical protein